MIILEKELGPEADYYALNALGASGFLGKALSLQWAEWSGTATAIVPDVIDPGRVPQLEVGGLNTANRALLYSAHIGANWVKGAGKFVVTPHWLGRSTDSWLESEKAPPFVTCGEEVFYLLKDSKLANAYFERVCMVPPYVTFLTSAVPVPRPRTAVNPGQLADWASVAKRILVSAYDGESFISFRRVRSE